MEKESLKPIWVSEADYEKLLARVDKKRQGTIAQQQGEWCLTAVIIDGDQQHVVCLGGACPWYKRIFGGDCVGHDTGSCSCSWGILEPIFGLFR